MRYVIDTEKRYIIEEALPCPFCAQHKIAIIFLEAFEVNYKVIPTIVCTQCLANLMIGSFDNQKVKFNVNNHTYYITQNEFNKYKTQLLSLWNKRNYVNKT